MQELEDFSILETPHSTAQAVADWFIGYAQINEYLLTAKALQKLLYFAQAHFLDEYRGLLFEEDIKAYEHGPVVYSIWKEHQIDNLNDNKSRIESYGVFLHREVNYEEYDSQLNEFLIKVWNTYGNLHANYLERKTHLELPWVYTWHSEEDDGDIIKPSLILGYYTTRGEFSDGPSSKVST